MFGNRHFGVELHLAGVEALEQQIKRHDLGQRSRMTAGVGIVGGEGGAGIAVDDDRGERRAVALACFLVVAGVGVVTGVPVMPRFGVGGCEEDRCGDRDQPENANPQNTRGAQGCAKHELPRPNFCLDHRFVRPNYAQPLARFPCSNRSIAAGFSRGTAVDAAIRAKSLCENAFRLPARTRTSLGIRLGGLSFQKINYPLHNRPAFAANCRICASHKYS